MSTRATYRFIPDDLQFKPAITIYIHHDGYPEGASYYLEGVNTVEDFIRKNDRAEITANHDVHGDTEYRYDIYQNGDITAFKREGWGENAIWEQFFNDLPDRFIETYQNTPIAKAINSN